MAHALVRRSHRRRRANPFTTGRGKSRRTRRLDGRFAKRAGYRPATRHGRRVVLHNPLFNPRRRRRHSRALSRLFANPYLAGRGRKRRWHRLDGKFSKRAGGRRIRKHGRRHLHHNPRRARRHRRHSRAIVRRHGRRRRNHAYANPRAGKRKGAKRGKSKHARRVAAARKAARTRAKNARRKAVFKAYALGGVRHRESRTIRASRMSRRHSMEYMGAD
jgi:hypothetical protein